MTALSEAATVNVIRYSELGNFSNRWLNAHYHFSFSGYYNPDRMGMGILRVINDDIISAKGGFNFHPHDNMEIITYVRQGAITHRDNLGNEGITKAGEIQVMSAGSGIIHSEHNYEDIETTLYQIWILPHSKDVNPRWEQRAFPKAMSNKNLPLLVSGLSEHQEQKPLFINANAAIYGGRVAAGAAIEHDVKGAAYILVSEGAVNLDGKSASKGDAFEITSPGSIEIHASDDSELVLIDLP